MTPVKTCSGSLPFQSEVTPSQSNCEGKNTAAMGKICEGHTVQCQGVSFFTFFVQS